jgi:hypothetical protein
MEITPIPSLHDTGSHQPDSVPWPVPTLSPHRHPPDDDTENGKHPDEANAQTNDLIDLLRRALGGQVPCDAVAECLATSMAQLAGSVHPQDLPEMAY